MNVPGGEYHRVTMQDAAVATGAGTALDVSLVPGGAFTVAAFQIVGITTATITFQATIDGTNWVAVQAENLANGTSATTATADGIYRLTTLGLAQVRANITSWTTGTIYVYGVRAA